MKYLMKIITITLTAAIKNSMNLGINNITTWI